MKIRRILFSRGLRYRVNYPVESNRRRTVDIAFTRRRVAVFVDGCFWHGCPVHGTTPKVNAAWWIEKIRRNQARDRDTTQILVERGWVVLRFWEHESSDGVAEVVSRVVRGRVQSSEADLNQA
ncbi:MAG: mismatch endonuclease, patch repair protein [Pseudonocardiales bacterium]|nr:mismatch endonuclease, patch repair protein [Pseudonocardiales bacterium]